MKQCVSHIENYKTILRHFDIGKICEFLMYVHKKDYINDVCKISSYFESINDINTNTLKTYYLFVLKRLRRIIIRYIVILIKRRKRCIKVVLK